MPEHVSGSRSEGARAGSFNRWKQHLLLAGLVGGSVLVTTGCLAVSALRQASAGPTGHHLAPHAAAPAAFGAEGPGPLYAMRSDPPGWAPTGPQAPQWQYFRQISDSSWRTWMPAATIYPLLLRQLSSNYIILSSDPRALSVQTDWDKFFLGGRLFRNRLSVTLFQVSGGESEVLVNNKVEYFRSPDERTGADDADWIPTQDVTNEKADLIESLTRIAQAMRTAQSR